MKTSTVPPEALARLLREEGLEPIRQVVQRPWPTISRWITRGVRGVQLEAIRDGGLWKTSQAALDRFRARLTGQVVKTPILPAATVRKRAAAAMAEVEKIGRKQ